MGKQKSQMNSWRSQGEVMEWPAWKAFSYLQVQISSHHIMLFRDVNRGTPTNSDIRSFSFFFSSKKLICLLPLKIGGWEVKCLLHHQAQELLTQLGFSLPSLLLSIPPAQRSNNRSISLENLPTEKWSDLEEFWWASCYELARDASSSSVGTNSRRRGSHCAPFGHWFVYYMQA